MGRNGRVAARATGSPMGRCPPPRCPRRTPCEADTSTTLPTLSAAHGAPPAARTAGLPSSSAMSAAAINNAAGGGRRPRLPLPVPLPVISVRNSSLRCPCRPARRLILGGGEDLLDASPHLSATAVPRR